MYSQLSSVRTIYVDLQTFTPDVKIVKLRPVIKLYFPAILEGDRWYGRTIGQLIGIQPDANLRRVRSKFDSGNHFIQVLILADESDRTSLFSWSFFWSKEPNMIK